MDAFSVMLKGRDGEDAYHITVSVAHHTAEAAEELACDYASQEGWNIVEIEQTRQDAIEAAAEEPTVIDTTSRIYLDAGMH
jgi:hypothetical protein